MNCTYTKELRIVELDKSSLIQGARGAGGACLKL